LREKSTKLQALRICRQFLELQNQLSKDLTIGFVPTMGALHDGHLSLIKKAASENEFVVVSIFVNPLQFNNNSDLVNYPRQEAIDIHLLENTGCNLLFLPDNAEEVFELNKKQQEWDFKGLDNTMEGASRPGHFKGVAEVVSRFFEIIKPQKAYFGEKDFQQLLIIRSMTQMKGFPVKIVPCPILREPSGLAMSSRNQRLTNQGKEDAAVLFEILKMIKHQKEGSLLEDAQHKALEMIKNFKDIQIDYLLLAKEENLEPYINIHFGKNLRIFIAATVEGIRLIDNMPLD
jgi:pantoate--beta-alanine ligase